MSLIYSGGFIYLGVRYDNYYDTGLNTMTVNTSGGTPLTSIPFPNDGTDSEPGDLISEFCSDNPDTTLVQNYRITTTPFLSSTLTADSPSCPTGGGGGGCDLTITSLVTTDETSTGADDGTLIINSSGSGGDVQYSIDNITFQSSNTFTGIAPGSYTAYVTNDTPCAASTPFQILAWSNPIQQFSDDLPIVTVTGAGISRWNAAFNPIVVNFQRKDFTVVGVTQFGSTQIRVELSGTIAQFLLAINSALYLKTDNYEFYGKADSYSETGGHGVFLITEVYTVDDSSGYFNIPDIKPGYEVEVEVKYGLDPLHPNFINPTYVPSKTGATRADLAPFLQTLLNFKDTYNYTDASYSDTSIAASFTIRYREVFSGGTGTWFAAPYPLYIVRAAMQLGENYAGNMAQYVPFLTTTSPGDKAKFLTDYEQPIYWQGLPFEISFIYSENVIDKELFLELAPDCGGGDVTGFLLNADAGFLTDVDGGRFIISRSDVSGVPVIEALGVNRVLIPDSFDCCASNIIANIYYFDTDGTTKIYIMQPMTIRTVCACETDLYVYIKWVNSRGSWDYYRFGYNQFLNASISNDVAVKRFVLNWSNDDTIEDVIAKSSIRTLRVGATLIDKDTANALQWARKSVKAMMLVNTNPVKWQTVIIKAGDTDVIQSRKRNSDVSFELLLPSDNIAQQ